MITAGALCRVGSLSPADIAAWQSLAREAVEPNIFYEPGFLLPAIRHLGSKQDVRLFVLWTGEPHRSPMAGLVPIAATTRYRRWRVPHVGNWMHDHGFLGTPLIRPGFEQQFWQSLLLLTERHYWGGFFHLSKITADGPVALALQAVCARQTRSCEMLHPMERAFLHSNLSPDAYAEAALRGKKRKELRRQRKRLEDLGTVTVTRSDDTVGIPRWTEEFLELESRGWKGKSGSAMGQDSRSANFLRDALVAAADAGRLQRVDLRLNGAALAMLINFRTPPGSFSFKTAFDERYARFSPGVLLQLENLDILTDASVAWMDSCAAQDHPMIDTIWSGRRQIASMSLALNGWSRQLYFRAVRAAEATGLRLKKRREGQITVLHDNAA